MRQIKVLALTRYGTLGASSRMRTHQYLPWLAAEGIQVDVQPLFSNETLTSKYQNGGYTLGIILKCFSERIAAIRKKNSYDLLWIEKEALPWWPLWIERTLLNGTPYILDYDDALFHNYDMHRIYAIRK